jgi:hypothetical protein
VQLRHGDSLPVANRMVVLHQVTVDTGGPVDSTLTNRFGAYRLRSATRDTAAGYVVSVDHQGIGYFSEPLGARDRAADSASTIVVFDTAYGRPEIVVAERHLIVRSLGQNGVRRVVELLVLENRGELTRITDDQSQPVWQGALPQAAFQFEVGPSDVSPETVLQVGDSIAVVAPLPPGEKQIMVAYLVSGDLEELAVPVDHAVTSMNFMLEDAGATVESDRFVPGGVELLDEIPFMRFSASAVPQGTMVTVRFGAPPSPLTRFWWLIVPLSGATLAGALFWWLRRQPAPVSSDAVATLASRIAQLDREFESKATPSRAETESHRRQRAELKAKLAELLATERHPN